MKKNNLINDGHIVVVNDEKEKIIKKRMKRIRRTRFKARLRRGAKKVLTAPIRLINRFREPLPIEFDREYEGVVPMCPNCHEVAFNKTHCTNCGQRFLETVESEKWFTPKTEQGECFMCGADVTIHISRVNGHKRYECGKCGSKVVS